MKYFWLTIKHKWFVLLAGLKTGCSVWRLIKHDLSKFLPSELPHYNRQFFGKADRPDKFIECWTKHQNRNDHHWEYWIPRTGHNRCDPPHLDNEPIPMSINAVKEMVADWMAASRAYTGEWPDQGNWMWLKNNMPKMKLHKDTVEMINMEVTRLIVNEVMDEVRHG